MSYTRIDYKKKWDGQISADAGYQYVLAYMMSELRLVSFDNWSPKELLECLEVRLFGKDAELHLFREDDEWMAVSVRDLLDCEGSVEEASGKSSETSSSEADIACVGGSQDIDSQGCVTNADVQSEVEWIECEYATIDRVHKVRKNCKKDLPGCDHIIIREYIAYDGDGQAYTVRTRLVGIQ